MVIKTCAACLCLLCASGIARAGDTVSAFDYGFIKNDAMSGAKNHVNIERISRKPLVYRAWGVWSFPFPIENTVNVALDFERYADIFRHVHRSERVADPAGITAELGTWYIEGRGGGIARIWAIGDIDSLVWDDSLTLRCMASQNEDSALNARYRETVDDLYNLEVSRLRLAAIVHGRQDTVTTVGIVAQAQTAISIPQWLFKLGIRIILPRTLKDIEKELESRRDRASKERGGR